jgi:hypothetical protein
MGWMAWRTTSGRPYLDHLFTVLASEEEVGGERPDGRGLHSSTFQLNVSAFCGIGVACRGC